MADVTSLNKLTKAQLVEFSKQFEQFNAQPLTEEATKQNLVENLEPVATDDQLAEYVAAHSAPADPATAPDPAVDPAAGYPKVENGVRFEYDPTEPDNPIFARSDSDFINLAESPAGYGKTEDEALAQYNEQVEKAKDPANHPDSADAVNGDIKVGQDVYYPYEDAEGGYRRAEVTSVEGDTVEVVWADGSRRWFNRDVLKLEV